MIWYMTWYDIWYVIWYMVCDMIYMIYGTIYDMIYNLLGYDTWYIIWYDIYDIFYCNWVWHPVAVVQYTFTHKQYTDQHNRHKQYIEQHSSLVRKSAGRAPSLRGIPWHLLITEEKARKTLSHGSRRMSVGKEYTEESTILNKNT